MFMMGKRSAWAAQSNLPESTIAPPMLVPESDREGADFARFVAEFPAFDHVETGLGIIFAAWRSELGWRRVPTDAERKIYGGVLFHVVGATFRTWVDVAPLKRTALARWTRAKCGGG